jgi:hypothetical protein
VSSTERILRNLAARQAGCVSYPQAVAAGCAPAALANGVRRKRWVVPFRGVLQASDRLPTAETNAWAAVLTQWRNGRIRPGVAAAYGTGARVWLDQEFWLPSGSDIVVPRGSGPCGRPGLRTRHVLIEADDLCSMDGLPLTTPVRTVLDLARHWRREVAIMAADRAIALGHFTPQDLRMAAARLSGLPGAVKAREVAELARAGVDSPPESRMRITLLDADLPCPTVNHKIVGEDGVLLARGELVYDDLLLWLEYDGYAEHSGREAFRRDRSRRRWLEARGWQVMVFTDVEVFRVPAQLVREVRRALEAAPRRVAALPSELSPEVAAAQNALRLNGFWRPAA